ncbi:MAG: hypothetical protein H6970_03645 [Gammaproteobacteria bacterium]|nr:hypothetical protein [Gammaproteobacteria bacterium]
MKIIAHRGASGLALENTLYAFRLAWTLDADGIELDIHLSHDKRIMVHHDDRILGENGALFPLAATESAILRQMALTNDRLRCGATEPMPYLEEVLDAAPPGKQVWIEIKCDADIVPYLAATLGHSTHSGQIILISFQAEVLRACRAVMPTIPCYWILAKDTPGSVEAASIRIEQARRWGFAGLDPDYRLLNEDLIIAARTAGLKLNAWTVNVPATARWLAHLGLDAITTDYPDLLRR